MTTVDQGMSVEEIERVIAERVVNAIAGYLPFMRRKPTWPFGNCKKVDHMTQDCRNHACARKSTNSRRYECGCLRPRQVCVSNSEVQKRVDKKISTLDERQD
ncbi:hypothetical protein Tco_0482027 [Tanacetum coccineum]